MIEVANARINNFAHVVQQASVLPSEEPIFVLTGSQLQEIISRAVQPLHNEIRGLKAIVANLEDEVSALEATQDLHAENQFIQLRLINDLRKKEPGKTEISRAEKIEKYLQARPDHRATFETLKGHLQVDNARLNETIKILMATSERSYSVQKEKTGDKRKRTLVMLPR